MRSLNIFLALLVSVSFVDAQVPTIEREALIALYDSTDGTNWSDNINWRNAGDTDFNDVGTECTWYGVTCAAVGTNVTALYLSSNQLSGTIPAEVGSMSSLLVLSLKDNQLSGSIPVELGNLTDLQTPYGLSIGYNALWTDDPSLHAFLDSKDFDWDETQTIAPAGLTVVSVSDRTAWLEWTPILYTADNGGYEVFSEPVVAREATSGGFTQTKGTTTFPVTGLVPGESYDFTVSTFTRAHIDNPQNTVISELTAPEMATTSDSGCAAPMLTLSGTFPYTLTASSHDTWEWSTGETTQSIEVRPHWAQWYWVKTTDVGGCEEAAVVHAQEDLLFTDDFESGDFSFWSDVE